MGEAKRRGTFEERKSLAEAQRLERIKAVMKLRRERLGLKDDSDDSDDINSQAILHHPPPQRHSLTTALLAAQMRSMIDCGLPNVMGAGLIDPAATMAEAMSRQNWKRRKKTLDV